MVDDDYWFRKPEPFGITLFAIGAAAATFVSAFGTGLARVGGGWCMPWLADLYNPVDWDAALVGGAVAGAGFAGAGRAIAHEIRRGAKPLATLFFVSTVAAVAGGLGATVPGHKLPGQWASLSVGYALVMVVLCVPPAIAVGRNWLRAQRGRLGSVMHATYRRAMALDATMFVVVVASLGARQPRGRLDVESSMARVALAGAIVAAVIGVGRASASWLRLRRLWRADWQPRDAIEPSGASEPVHDMGNGDDMSELVRAGGHYRDGGERLALLRGDTRRAFRAVSFSLGRAVAVLAIGALALAVVESGVEIPWRTDLQSPFCRGSVSGP